MILTAILQILTNRADKNTYADIHASTAVTIAHIAKAISVHFNGSKKSVVIFSLSIVPPFLNGSALFLSVTILRSSQGEKNNKFVKKVHKQG